MEVGRQVMAEAAAERRIAQKRLLPTIVQVLYTYNSIYILLYSTLLYSTRPKSRVKQDLGNVEYECIYIEVELQSRI